MPTISFSFQKLKDLPLPPRSAGGGVAQLDYWDESMRGFDMRISSSGARTWMLIELH
jgi:hypothetical protein